MGMNHSSAARAVFQHRPKDECGVFAVFGHPHAAEITFYGLYALQHRGQESAGIVTHCDKERKFKSHHGMGLVPQVFNAAEIAKLPARVPSATSVIPPPDPARWKTHSPSWSIARAVRSLLAITAT